MILDYICDIDLGDTGKGRVCAALINKNSYDFCMRAQGGPNAGHQILIGEEKVTTNIVPSGALFGVKSIIGSECYLNERLFFAEMERLSKVRPDISNLIKISNKTHIITEDHIKEEASESKVGSTRRGIGPCARDKYSRSGIRAESVPTLREFVIDTYDELNVKNPDAKILVEGAQGFYLDISHGDYPYVTSSHCSIGGVLNNGFNHRQIRDVYGVIKGYTTYVGNKQFQDLSDPVLAKLAETGHEKGSVTGRTRQVNYLDLNKIIRAIDINGVNKLIVNKMDIMEKVGAWKMWIDGALVDLKDQASFKQMLQSRISNIQITYSYSASHYQGI